jgi:hypothetical protein
LRNLTAVSETKGRVRSGRQEWAASPRTVGETTRVRVRRGWRHHEAQATVATKRKPLPNAVRNVPRDDKRLETTTGSEKERPPFPRSSNGLTAKHRGTPRGEERHVWRLERRQGGGSDQERPPSPPSSNRRAPQCRGWVSQGGTRVATPQPLPSGVASAAARCSSKPRQSRSRSLLQLAVTTAYAASN